MRWTRIIVWNGDDLLWLKSWANDYLFIDTYKSNKIKIGMNEMRMNDSEMSVRLMKDVYG